MSLYRTNRIGGGIKIYYVEFLRAPEKNEVRGSILTRKRIFVSAHAEQGEIRHRRISRLFIIF